MCIRDSFRKEYCGQDKLSIVLPDITFSDKMTLDLGGITAQIFHTISPHSEDTTCVYVPEEKVLFLGEDVYKRQVFECAIEDVFLFDVSLRKSRADSSRQEVKSGNKISSL